MSNFHPVAATIESILNEGGFWYERFEHEPVRTSEEASRVRPEYSLRQGAKSLILKGKRGSAGRQFIMVVVPGDRQFDKQKLRDQTGYSDVRFATPDEVGHLTGGIIPGGVPPWGNLFNLPVFADTAIFANKKIIFNAGDRSVSVAMYSEDYRKLAKPQVYELTQ